MITRASKSDNNIVGPNNKLYVGRLVVDHLLPDYSVYRAMNHLYYFLLSMQSLYLFIWILFFFLTADIVLT